MKKTIKIYKVNNGGVQIRIPLWMSQELELFGEEKLEIENKLTGEIILKKIKKNVKKNVDNQK